MPSIRTFINFVGFTSIGVGLGTLALILIYWPGRGRVCAQTLDRLRPLHYAARIAQVRATDGCAQWVWLGEDDSLRLCACPDTLVLAAGDSLFKVAGSLAVSVRTANPPATQVLSLTCCD
ncbi:MAG: hypothetical protein OHK0039_49250 [Bacteroidia bacterium]